MYMLSTYVQKLVYNMNSKQYYTLSEYIKLYFMEHYYSLLRGRFPWKFQKCTIYLVPN